MDHTCGGTMYLVSKFVPLQMYALQVDLALYFLGSLHQFHRRFTRYRMDDCHGYVRGILSESLALD